MTIHTFLPMIGNGPNEASSPVMGEGGDPAYAFFARMANDPRQGRSVCLWNDLLAKVAQARVECMARDGWFGHVDPEGLGPNYDVREAGYKLPGWYETARDANNVESIACGGTGELEQIWEGFLRSPTHRRHILGETDFFKAQTQVGVGFIFDEQSKSKFYWSVLSAPMEES